MPRLNLEVWELDVDKAHGRVWRARVSGMDVPLGAPHRFHPEEVVVDLLDAMAVHMPLGTVVTFHFPIPDATPSATAPT